MKFVKSALILILTVCVFGAAMFGLNKLTGPIIEANQAGAELAPLLASWPEGSSFGKDALIYDSANASASSLTASARRYSRSTARQTARALPFR